MDAFNLLWSITGVAFIILIFVVLLCLLGFMTSAIAERRTAKAIESGFLKKLRGYLVISPFSCRLIALLRLITFS